MDTEKNNKISLNSKDWALSCFRTNENFKFITALEQKPQPVSEKFNVFHRYLLWFVKQLFYYSLLANCIQMTTAKLQRKMSYRSSVTVNFVYATKFCIDPPFFNGSCPRALSTQCSAHHTSRKSQLACFPALPFFRPEPTRYVDASGNTWQTHEY